MERSLLAALVVLAVGVGVRSFAGDAGLWVGTAIVGSAIAVGNVLVPTIVKRDYRNHVSFATGVYSACITIGASIASAVAVPLSIASAVAVPLSNGVGWRGALAFWAIPAIVVALAWATRAKAGGATDASAHAATHRVVSVWRQSTAWLVTAYMGLQSTTFYVMATWLPTIETSHGASAEQAGLRLFLFQLVGIASGLAIPRLMRRADNQVAAAGPVVTGLLAQQTGGWQASLAMVGVLAVTQVVIAVFVGRGRRPDAVPEP